MVALSTHAPHTYLIVRLQLYHCGNQIAYIIKLLLVYIDMWAKIMKIYIIYGGPDANIACQFARHFHRKCCEVFFFENSKLPGKPLNQMMRDGIEECDKALVLCSAESLIRPGVLYEIERALAREAREGGKKILIPVNIDDYLYASWKPADSEMKKEITDRCYFNIRNKNSKSMISYDLSKLSRAILSVPAIVPREFHNELEALGMSGSVTRWRVTKTFYVNQPGVHSIQFGFDPSPGQMRLEAAAINGIKIEVQVDAKSGNFEITTPCRVEQKTIIVAELTVVLEGSFAVGNTFMKSILHDDYENFSYRIETNGHCEIQEAWGISGAMNQRVPVVWSRDSISFSLKKIKKGGFVGVEWKW